MMVHPVRRPESQSLSGSHIQFSGNFVAIGLGYFAHARPLLEILPKQSIEVFVGASLPRVIRVGKVALDGVNLLKNLAVMELRSVVKGDRLEPLAMLRDRLYRRLIDLSHRVARQLLDDGQARLALDQRQHTVMLVRANDRANLDMIRVWRHSEPPSALSRRMCR
jgi:hypothetical protein